MAKKNVENLPRFTANYPHAEDTNLLSIRDRLRVSTTRTGRGVTMAYLDAGFYMHNDVQDRILLHVDATTNHIVEEKEISHTDVTSWHGLMVSAIGSGNGLASKGYYRGLASESDLVLIKVSNPRLQVKEPDIQRGFDWLIANHERFNIRVVNVSVGGDHVTGDPNHPLHQAVSALVDAGVAVVVSSGNHGRDTLVPPASSPQAIVVGGYNDNNSANPDDWAAYHSNYGYAYEGTPKPDLIAPAEWLPSPILPETFVATEAHWLGALLTDEPRQILDGIQKRGYRDLNLAKKQVQNLDIALYQELQNRIYAHKLISKYYQFVDGTSVAAPIVSATIALMLEANPTLSVHQIRTILQDTASLLPVVPPKKQGAGVIQVDRAVEQASTISGNN